MVDFTYGMTLECDLAGSQWIRWKSGFLCGLSGVIAAQFVTLDGVNGNGDMICGVSWMDRQGIWSWTYGFTCTFGVGQLDWVYDMCGPLDGFCIWILWGWVGLVGWWDI